MASIGELIEFLMSLMSDDETKAAFERDPEATLASKGLSGVTEQDVQDARLIMAEGGGGAGHAAQPQHITQNVTETNEIDLDQTIVDIDDRDTTVIDSFNSDDEVVAIQDNSRVVNVEDSFNEAPEGGASPGDKKEDGLDTEPEPQPGPEPEPEPDPALGIEPVEDEPELEPEPELPVG